MPITANGTIAHLESNTGGSCFNVSGFVLGNIISNSSVYLYQSSSLDYDAVMMRVRTADPIQTERVNKYAEFNFKCLPYGKYVVSIPSKLYANNSVGAPLPYENKSGNAELSLVFQGGDYQYLVSVFTIDVVSD